MNRDLLRKLPAVDSLLRDTRVSDYIRDNSRRAVADAIRIVLNEEREYIKKSGLRDYQFNMEAFMGRVRAQMEKINPSYKPRKGAPCRSRSEEPCRCIPSLHQS